MRARRDWIQLCLLGALLVLWPAVVRAQFTCITNADNTITITGYTGSNGVVIIPDTIDTFPVVSIADWAFYNSTNVTTVMISSNVFNIGNYTFYDCTGLANVTIPDSVTNIGISAFAGCLSLTHMSIPGSITSISDSIFQNCTSLASVSVPDSVAEIRGAAFENCYSLAGVTIPNGVTNLGASAFEWCTSLTNITVPNGVTTIDVWTFDHCRHLSSVTIPNSATNIGAWAFEDCTSLTNITIPNRVIDIGIYAFYSCDNLKGVFFSGNAPSGDSSIFQGDTNAVIAYYLWGTAGWSTFASQTGVPVVLWNPQAQTGDGGFGVGTNGFGFNIAGTTNIPIVVEAASNLVGPWTTAQSCTLTNGLIFFSDPQWTNYHSRFYRIRSP